MAAAIPNIGQWVKNPVMYEIGSKTLPHAKYAELGLQGLSTIQKGQRIVQAQGWLGALTPSMTSAYSTTISTGLTPGGYLAGIAGLDILDRVRNK